MNRNIDQNEMMNIIATELNRFLISEIKRLNVDIDEVQRWLNNDSKPTTPEQQQLLQRVSLFKDFQTNIPPNLYNNYTQSMTQNKSMNEGIMSQTSNFWVARCVL